MVEAAIERRQAGADRQPSEHWLQAVLRDCPGLLGLQDRPVLRELPAFRPKAGVALRRGFVDLVGVTQDGRIGVVETKLGSDPMLVLQGLDYWTWVTAHGKELAEMRGTVNQLNKIVSAYVRQSVWQLIALIVFYLRFAIFTTLYSC